MTDPRRDAHRAIEAVARHSYGRLVAYLASRTHDVAGAEDALGDALVAALTKWPSDGVPNSPEAWLLTTARNRLIDRNRHHRVRERVRERVHNEDALELLSHGVEEPMQADPFPDDRLKLLFVCAHPAIDPAMHTPLMLQAVLGLDAAAIARAFVVAPTTMSQRLVRAKAKIRETGIAFEVPEADQLGERLEAVLNAVYAAFGSGWDAIPGIDSASVGLTDEAIWLARVLSERLPDEPEVRGLLALMLYCDARRAARRGSDGRFIPLSEQDPARWDSASIAEAERELVLAGAAYRPGRFQLEAAIQSAHAERARTGVTDWSAIATLYEGLVRLAPTLGAQVGRAAAVAEVHGAAMALALLDDIDAQAASYQPYWAVRAHLLQRLARIGEAEAAFDRAVHLATDPAVRSFLQRSRNARPHLG
jgi:predicted RNA polymerase sigma factor